jgi:hypothetical protein
MTDGFEIISVEIVVAWCRYCTGICLNGVKITMKDVGKIVAPYASRTGHLPNENTGRFIMFSVTTNVYNKKTKGPTLMEFFTATGKLKKFLLRVETFDVCTTGDTAHIDKIFKFLLHTRQHGCIDILHCWNDPCL